MPLILFRCLRISIFSYAIVFSCDLIFRVFRLQFHASDSAISAMLSQCRFEPYASGRCEPQKRFFFFQAFRRSFLLLDFRRRYQRFSRASLIDAASAGYALRRWIAVSLLLSHFHQFLHFILRRQAIFVRFSYFLQADVFDFFRFAAVFHSSISSSSCALSFRGCHAFINAIHYKCKFHAPPPLFRYQAFGFRRDFRRLRFS